jgi:O-antigen/teichoic acid export membrane protein
MRTPLSLTQLSVASTATEALLAGATVVSTAYLVRHLGTEEYGILALVALLAGQFSLLQLGAGQAAMRRVAECRARDDMPTYAATRYAVFGYGLGASLLAAAAASMTLRWAFAGGLHLSTGMAAIAASSTGPAILVLALQPVARAIAGVLQGQERFVALVALRFAQGLGSITATVIAVALGAHAPGVLWTSAVTSSAALVVSAGVAGLLDWPRVPFRHICTAARALVPLALPFAAVGLLSGLLVDVEKLAIALSRSVEDFTYYTVPFGVILRLSTLAAAFAVMLAPRLARLSEAGQIDAARELTRDATRLSVTALAVAVIPMLAVTRELLAVWLGGAFAERATLPARILFVALLVNVSAYAASAALQARARPATLIRLYLIELPLHLIVVFLLVSRWGILGAACAWTARVVIDTLAQWWLARRTLHGSVAGAAELHIVLTGAAVAVVYELVEDHVAWPLRLATSAIVVAGLLVWLLSRRDRLLVRALFTVTGSPVDDGSTAPMVPSSRSGGGTPS